MRSPRWMWQLAMVSAVLTLASRAAGQPWNDGAPSRLQHICNNFISQTVEDLTWTWVGYQGQPKSGDVYYVRVVVGALGCSGAFVRPELKLPRKTQFAITPQTPIRCFMEPPGGGARTQITDGCPSAPVLGLYPFDNTAFPNPSGSGYSNAFWALPPSSQPYWPLYNRILTIEVPVRTTLTGADAPLSGFASGDYLLGAANVLDNNPGGPTNQWDGHPQGYSGGAIPSRGAWQGVFLSQSPSTVTRLVYPEPSARNITQTSAQTHIHVYNAGCVSPAQAAMTLLYADGGDTGPEALDTTVGGCSPVGDGGQDCFLRWIYLLPGTEYLWWSEFVPGSTTACGNVQVDPARKYFRTASPPGVTRYAVLVSAGSGGSVALNPPGGSYTAGTQVMLTATANTDSLFSGWTLDGVAQAGPNPLTVVTNAEHVVLARFSPKPLPDGGAPDSGAESDAGLSPPPVDGGGGSGTDGGGSSTDGGGGMGAEKPGCSCSQVDPAIIAVAVVALLARRRIARRPQGTQ